MTNRTTGRPAAGSKVTLLQQGMTELASGTTDAKGNFSIDAPSAGPYLLRVMQDGASYYEPATEGTPVNVDVYSAGAHVVGVTTEVLMLRAQTDPSGAVLNVTEDFVVKNASKPAMTQFSKAPFNVYLPEGAVVEATAAKGPNGMPTAEELKPQAEKGLYSVMFPIKPGETQIEIAYHIPYTGNLKVNLKMAGQVDMFAVSLPKSDEVRSDGWEVYSGEWRCGRDDLPAAQFKAGAGGGVRHCGSGTVAAGYAGWVRTRAGRGSPVAGDGSAGAPVDNAPGKGLGNPLDPNGTQEPVSTKYKWWILGGLGLLLVAAAGVLLRKPVVAPVVGVAASQDVVRPVGARVGEFPAGCADGWRTPGAVDAGAEGRAVRARDRPAARAFERGGVCAEQGGD